MSLQLSVKRWSLPARPKKVKFGFFFNEKDQKGKKDR